MPYVERNAAGAIIAVFGGPQTFAEEFVGDGDPALITFALLNYATAKQTSVMTGGTTVNVGTAAAPINVMASTDGYSLALLEGVYTAAQANSAATFNWVEGFTAVTLTAAQIITIYNAAHVFMQNSFNVLTAALAGIDGGTITTQAQIDALAWGG